MENWIIFHKETVHKRNGRKRVAKWQKRSGGHTRKKSEFHSHLRSPSDDLMYWTVKTGRKRKIMDRFIWGIYLNRLGG